METKMRPVDIKMKDGLDSCALFMTFLRQSQSVPRSLRCVFKCVLSVHNTLMKADRFPDVCISK